MKTKDKYAVFPRFTTGEAGAVDRETALHVLQAEQTHIDNALSGGLGAAARAQVKLQGTRFIVVSMRSAKQGWRVTDLMDHTRHLWPHRLKCPTCTTSCKCRHGKIVPHDHEGAPCDGSDRYVGHELDAAIISAAETYGAEQPTQNADIVMKALGKAAAYRNKLTEIERERREREATLLNAVGDVAIINEQIKALEDEQEVLQKRMKQAKSGKTKAERSEPDPADVQRARAIKELLKPLRARRKEIRAHVRSAVVQDEIKVIQDTYKEEYREARAKRDVYWGTGGIVEEAADQSFKTVKKGPPKFVPFRGQGAIAVQIQHGVPWRDLFGTTNQQVRIDPIDPSAWTGSRAVRRRACKTVMHLRVSSDADRKPVWASFPFWMHRSPPDRAVVKKIKAIRRRDGHRFRWSIVVTYDVPRDDVVHTDVPDNRAEWVGIDVGWRAFREDKATSQDRPQWTEDDKLTREEGVTYATACRLADVGRLEEAFNLLATNPKALKRLKARMSGPHSIRVACWHGSDGVSGELVLDPSYSRARKRMEDLESTTKKNFNECVPKIVAWLEQNPVSSNFLIAVKPLFRTAGDSKPDAAPFTQEVMTARLKEWEAPSRLHVLRDLWYYFVIDNDEEVWRVLNDWHHQDKHLVDWIRSLKRKARGRRRELYRLFAAEMGRKYKTFYIEDFELPDVIEKPPVEEEKKHRNKLAEQNRRTAGVSVLRDALKNVGRTCVVEYIAVAANETTRQCAECGSIETWDQAKYVMHTCSGCGATWDQDFNAGKNIGERGANSTN